MDYSFWFCTRLIASLLVTCSVAPALSAEPAVDWPQWRGPTRDGIVAADTPWPTALAGDALKLLWRVELGPSYSGPIVGRGMVFTTETAEQKWEVVRAFDLASGEQRWDTRWEGSMSVPFFAASNGSWIRATPAFDGQSLFVAGMRDVLVCLDAETGNQTWKVDFVEQLKTPLPAFGFASSPLLDRDWIYVQAGGALTKLDKRTGQIIWQSLKDGGGMWGSAFSSPFLTDLAGRPQLLVQTREKLAGVDPDSGDVLWSQEIEAFRGMNILTPTVYDSAVFTSSYGGRSQLIRPTESDGSWKADLAWDNRLQGYMSTPVVIGGHAYLHLRNQRFACIDLEDGEICWVTEPYGKYWSLVAQGSRILALDERGELLLIAADPSEFKLIDSRHISDQPTWAHLAVVGDQVFIRELNALSVYRWSENPLPARTP